MTLEKIQKTANSLKICSDSSCGCLGCSYNTDTDRGDCVTALKRDAVKVLETYISMLAIKRGSHPCEDSTGTQNALTRGALLNMAKAIVSGRREQDYGSPEDSFGRIAALWTAYKDIDFSPVDVAVMMALLKIARISVNPEHMDSWVDLAGYAACGGEISGREDKV